MGRPFLHLDLFTGIGGFSLAAQTVWGSNYHCVGFCEIDPFCQQVLRKNFEGVRIYGDIRGLTKERIIADSKGTGLLRTQESQDDVPNSEGGRGHDPSNQDSNGLTAERLAADTKGAGCETFGGNGVRVGSRGRDGLASRESGKGTERLAADSTGQGLEGREQESELSECQQPSRHSGERLSIDLLTGGFPCQPFSTAGKRKGTEDDRFLWPEMLRVIREVKPRWIIGENVAGIIEMALGQVCADLESLGYEVQCFVIPACAVNAPHRRDRVWIIAHAGSGRRERGNAMSPGKDAGYRLLTETDRVPCDSQIHAVGTGLCESESERQWGRKPEGNVCPGGRDPEHTFPDWSRNWREVAFESCVRGVDDGLPRRVVRFSDGATISESRWRQNALKAYGNAIVPQVAMEIMRAIKAVDND
ncbi:MAG: DNA cytosine methyltransferase [Patescibacteria group bacterium]